MSRAKSSDRIHECPREREALESVLRDERPSDLAAHLASCANCREIVAVSTWLQGVARERLAVGLPQAERLWWRAQIERRLEGRRRLAERAARPIRWFERGAAVTLGLVALELLRSYGIGAAGTALARFSDPAELAGLTAALMLVGGWAAREAARRT